MIKFISTDEIKNEIINNINNLKTIFFDPIDENSNVVKYNKKVYNDIVTKEMISMIGRENLFLLASYAYAKIYWDIEFSLKFKLLEKGYRQLNGNESVNLIFKGGNVYNHYFTKLLSESQNLNDNGKKIINQLLPAFTISDNDFELLILCEKSRFMQIYEATLGILYESLSEIRNLFEKILTDPSKDEKKYDISHKSIDPVSANLISYILKITKNILYLSSEKTIEIPVTDSIKYKKTNEVIKILNQNLKNFNFSKESRMLVNSLLILEKTITNYIDIITHIANIITKDLYNIIKFKELLDNLVKINLTFEIINQDNITIITDLSNKFLLPSIDKIIYPIASTIKNSNFYDKPLTNIIDRFNQIPNKKFYGTKNSKEIEYIINDNLKSENIKLGIRSDFIITKKDNPIIITQNKKQHSHYISYNNSIISNKYNFDLMRIKLNIELLNAVDGIQKLKVPSEFIDIAIQRPSKEYEMLKDNINKYTSIMVENNKMIRSYNFVYALHDLQKMIFRNIPFPWVIEKQSKAVIRMIFSMLLNIIDGKMSKHILGNIMLLCFNVISYAEGKINKLNISKFTDKNYSRDTIIEKLSNMVPIYDLIELKSEFGDVKYLINFIICFGMLYHYDDLITEVNNQRLDFNYVKLPLEKIDEFKSLFVNFVRIVNLHIFNIYVLYETMIQKNN